jgi:hypothetical protein
MSDAGKPPPSGRGAVTAAARDLPRPIPARIARLPVSRIGYPVPRFVAWVDGEPDFRLVDERYLEQSLRRKLCWLCGDVLGVHVTFPIGPMCAVNRTTAEPPSHRGCALFAVRACPFLSNPAARRRERGLPDGHVPPAGEMIRRNPGVTCLWSPRLFRPVRAGAGVRLRQGDPEAVLWFARGREATRAEVEASIASGMPLLRDPAEAEGAAAVRELERLYAAAIQFLPEEAA